MPLWTSQSVENPRPQRSEYQLAIANMPTMAAHRLGQSNGSSPRIDRGWVHLSSSSVVGRLTCAQPRPQRRRLMQPTSLSSQPAFDSGTSSLPWAQRRNRYRISARPLCDAAGPPRGDRDYVLARERRTGLPPYRRPMDLVPRGRRPNDSSFPARAFCAPHRVRDRGHRGRRNGWMGVGEPLSSLRPALALGPTGR